MNNRYTLWSVILGALLELGIFYLSYSGVIGLATTLSSGFAVGAVMVAALMLSDAAFEVHVDPAQDREDAPRSTTIEII